MKLKFFKGLIYRVSTDSGKPGKTLFQKFFENLEKSGKFFKKFGTSWKSHGISSEIHFNLFFHSKFINKKRKVENFHFFGVWKHIVIFYIFYSVVKLMTQLHPFS